MIYFFDGEGETPEAMPAEEGDTPAEAAPAEGETSPAEAAPTEGDEAAPAA